MVVLTLKYFARPDVPRYVFITVGYTWFCSISIIILVPADISSVNELDEEILFYRLTPRLQEYPIAAVIHPEYYSVESEDMQCHCKIRSFKVYG
ncbi:hypothetical protein L1987_18845 [Smallanthus sonchifolius]|uniref:Uncharacterized protein n=1 Tax=Smallanthus sonchifolius TaxID=185202 RepID=A0ACB9J3G3_9ASTR|nr:hypothetical protein L1987_18845 [Smallanthus sonchifolius]